ncbi:sugar phosphate isomerase/epimerase [Isoptericola chiayiensis]|uniref:Sugar phosphate isomerase/epimerase n=1 Tax=Isoptericola chiayiensis TaxID=579446 RepID=A0ABP8Y8S1_9MICO|nr:sugar phosphate isomerase/epimerase [Isoptericola chiayiensis]NOW00662.1 sugar phosphate isomerase/epimerase [Isoptericola chiayiensis]
MRKNTTRRLFAGTAAAALMATGLFAGSTSAATAAPQSDKANGAAQCAGRSVPASKISIQLFSYLGWQSQIGIDGVLSELDEIGFKNVEPFGSPGGFGSYGDYSADEFRDVLKGYGLKAPSSHGSTNEASFDGTLENAKDLGQKYVGSGGFAAPGIGGGYENVIATADTMNRLGERSVKNGTGKFFGHNHQSEFTTQYTVPETGETKSAWEILVENTDPRYVTFQLDTFWAADAGIDVADLLEEHGDRVELLHIKDGDLNGDDRGIPGNVGDGDMEWGPILEAAQGKVKLYVLERDGAPANADFARESFEFLTCFSY